MRGDWTRLSKTLACTLVVPSRVSNGSMSRPIRGLPTRPATITTVGQANPLPIRHIERRLVAGGDFVPAKLSARVRVFDTGHGR